MTKSGAESIFESLRKFNDVEGLINEGESESLYLECKTSLAPKLNADMKNHLAKAISGFSNANGGVLIYGIKTQKKSKRDGEAGSLDVLIEIESIGNVDSLMKSIRNAIPSLTVPSVLDFEIKTIKPKGKKFGVVVLLIKKSNNDPLQSTEDNHFYFRNGDEFIKAPHEVIKRLFAATDSPDIEPLFIPKIFQKDDNGYWKIPITVQNNSTAVGESVNTFVEIINPNCCDDIKCEAIKDRADVNPGKRVFIAELEKVLHRELPVVVGYIKIKMKPQKIKLQLKINLFANKMRAKEFIYTLHLNKIKFKIKKESEKYLY